MTRHLSNHSLPQGRSVRPRKPMPTFRQSRSQLLYSWSPAQAAWPSSHHPNRHRMSPLQQTLHVHPNKSVCPSQRHNKPLRHLPLPLAHRHRAHRLSSRPQCQQRPHTLSPSLLRRLQQVGARHNRPSRLQCVPMAHPFPTQTRRRSRWLKKPTPARSIHHQTWLRCSVCAEASSPPRHHSTTSRC